MLQGAKLFFLRSEPEAKHKHCLYYIILFELMTNLFELSLPCIFRTVAAR